MQPTTTGRLGGGDGAVASLRPASARRTLRFVWFGAEEMGVKGSEAYVKQHADELKDLLFMLNLDLGGG
jgi:Zn-dependent M28 family amino/carboxypeptidase